MDTAQISNLVYESSSLFGGSNLGSVAEWPSSGLLTRRPKFDSLYSYQEGDPGWARSRLLTELIVLRLWFDSIAFRQGGSHVACLCGLNPLMSVIPM